MTVVVFRYIPADEGGRFGDAHPALLTFHATFGSLEEYAQATLQPPGDFVAYTAKGKEDDDGVPPRFELEERVSVEPPDPAAPKVSKPKKFG